VQLVQRAPDLGGRRVQQQLLFTAEDAEDGFGSHPERRCFREKAGND